MKYAKRSGATANNSTRRVSLEKFYTPRAPIKSVIFNNAEDALASSVGDSLTR